MTFLLPRFPRLALLPLLLVVQLSTGCRPDTGDTEAPPPTENPAPPPSEDPAPPPPVDPPPVDPAPPPVAALDQPAFFEAALNGDLETVRDAIKRGTEVNQAGTDGRTALMFACFNGHAPVCRALIEAGAGIDLRDQTGRTALMYACTGQYEETVSLLVNHKADVNLADNEENWTPLMFAAAEGQAGVARILLAAGADPSAKDVDGEDAAMFASSRGHDELAKMITEAR